MLNQKDDNSLNSIIGIVLIFIILIGFSLYNQPTPEQLEALQQQRDSVELEQNKILEIQQQSTRSISKDNSIDETPEYEATLLSDTGSSKTLILKEAEQKYGLFAKASIGEKTFTVLENELIKVTFSSLGGSIYSVELKNFKTYDSLPVYLIKPDSSYHSLNFFSGNKSISTSDLYFVSKDVSSIVNGENSKTITMRMQVSYGKYIEYVYTLKGNSYDLGYSIDIVGLENTIASNSNYINMDWSVYIPRQEKSLKNERINTTTYFKYLDDEVDYLSETSDESKELTSKVKWIAFKQQFFSSILVANDHFEKPTNVENITDEEAHTYVKQLIANFSIPYDHSPNESFPMQFYFGPNHYETLESYDLAFEEIIPLGWGIFGWVNIGVIIPLFNFLGKFISSYGIIILILTIIIKVALFPFMYKSYLGTAKMRVLKPEVDAIGEKFPKSEDAMKKQQAVMALYKKAGANPLGGCLPMLVQMPILIAMYRFFPSSIELRQESFLWATDLSSYDSIYDFPNGFSIPFYGDHVSLFTLLMTIATLLSVKMNSEMTGGSQMQMPQMKMMMYIMPIMFLGFFNDFASALSYYYFIATMVTFGQQYLMRRFVDEDAILKKIEHNKKKPQKKSAFQKMLDQKMKDQGYKR